MAGSKRQMDFVFLREAASLSQRNQLLSINSSAENPKREVLFGRVLNGDQNGGSLDELNEISRLLYLVQKNGRNYVQTGMENEGFCHFGVGSSLYPLKTMLINDSDRTLIDLGNGDAKTNYDDISPVSIDRMVEYLSEPVGASNSNSLFHSSVNQMTQEQVNLNRKVVDFSNKYPADQGEVVIQISFFFEKNA